MDSESQLTYGFNSSSMCCILNPVDNILTTDRQNNTQKLTIHKIIHSRYRTTIKHHCTTITLLTNLETSSKSIEGTSTFQPINNFTDKK